MNIIYVDCYLQYVLGMWLPSGSQCHVWCIGKFDPSDHVYGGTRDTQGAPRVRDSALLKLFIIMMLFPW